MDIEERGYDGQVCALARSITDTIEAASPDFDITINALVLLLAYGGTQSDMPQEEFCSTVAAQLGKMMTKLKAVNTFTH